MNKEELYKLADGTELVVLEKEEKEKLEEEILAVLNKYNAVYLPVIKETKTLTSNTQEAVLYLLKKNTPIESPYKEDGTNETKEESETSKVD
jgi:hypothetical protein